MKGLLPIGPFDPGARIPLLLECEVERARVERAVLREAGPGLGLERAFEGLTPEEGAVLASHACGRCAVHHAAAFCEALESATGVEPPEAHAAFRVVVSEWARIASHLEVVSDVARALDDDLVGTHPRRHIARIRDAFSTLGGDPFGFGVVVPGGVRPDLDAGAFGRLAAGAAALVRDARFWAGKLTLSRPRLSGGRLLGGPDEEDISATAFRAGGDSADARAGEGARGFYRRLDYEPPVRDGGTPLDRTLLLLDEVASSLSLIDRASEAVGDGDLGPPSELPQGPGKGSAVGLWESPHGSITYRVFLGAEGRLLRARRAGAARAVIEATGRALVGAAFEDVVCAYVSLNVCPECAGF